MAQRLESATPAIVWRELSLVLNDDAAMRTMNAVWHAQDDTTDTFSFRYPSLPGEEPGVFGEIFVNVEEACRQGLRRRRSSPQKELALYIAHGIHHLAGATDDTPERRRAMIRAEWRWVAEADRNAPIEALFYD